MLNRHTTRSPPPHTHTPTPKPGTWNGAPGEFRQHVNATGYDRVCRYKVRPPAACVQSLYCDQTHLQIIWISIEQWSFLIIKTLHATEIGSWVSLCIYFSYLLCIKCTYFFFDTWLPSLVDTVVLIFTMVTDENIYMYMTTQMKQVAHIVLLQTLYFHAPVSFLAKKLVLKNIYVFLM